MPDLCLIVRFTLFLVFIKIIPAAVFGRNFFRRLSKPDKLWANNSQKFMNLKR